MLARERGLGAQHLRANTLDASISVLWPDASDGYDAVAALTDGQIHGLFRALGRGDLESDPRFATAPARERALALDALPPPSP